MKNEFGQAQLGELRASAWNPGALCGENFVMPLVHHGGVPKQEPSPANACRKVPRLKQAFETAHGHIQGAREFGLGQDAGQRRFGQGSGVRDDLIHGMLFEK